MALGIVEKAAIIIFLNGDNILSYFLTVKMLKYKKVMTYNSKNGGILMDIISIVNNKGGSGKSTLSFQMASWLYEMNEKILAIDLDAQSNFTQTARGEPGVIGSFELLAYKVDIMDCIQEREDNFDLIAADQSLSTADVVIQGTGKEFRLKEALRGLKKDYTHIIIDTPPNLGILTTNAMTASTRVVIAAQPDTYSSNGLVQLYNNIKLIRQEYNPKLEIDGILLICYKAQTVFSNYIREPFEKIAAIIGTRVYPVYIRDSITVKESQAARQSIFEYAGKSKVAQDFRDFMKEVFY